MRIANFDSGHGFWPKVLFAFIRAVSRLPVTDAVKLNIIRPLVLPGQVVHVSIVTAARPITDYGDLDPRYQIRQFGIYSGRQAGKTVTTMARVRSLEGREAGVLAGIIQGLLRLFLPAR
jgi:hypothetical protein